MRSDFEKIKVVQDYLQKKNILYLTVVAPSKADYYSEFLPDYYSSRISSRRNYSLILENAGKENVNLIDLNKWFKDLKDTISYPLFPKQGIHWSYYGMALSADSIIKYIEKKNNILLPDFSWTLEYPDTLRGTDYDLGDLLNIVSTLPYNKMTYPKFSFSNDTTKTPLLVIGDSFLLDNL